jgi:hypothetical protein
VNIDPPAQLAHLGRLWWDVHSMGFLLRPTALALALVTDNTTNITRRFESSVHVRRGDKTSGKASEASPTPLEYYVSDLERFAVRPGHKTLQVHIVTDDETVVFAEASEAQKQPNRVVQLQFPQLLSDGSHAAAIVDRFWMTRDIADRTQSLMELRNSDAIGLTLHSNFARLAMGMKLWADLSSRAPGTIVLTSPNSFDHGLVRPLARAPLGIDFVNSYGQYDFWAKLQKEGFRPGTDIPNPTQGLWSNTQCFGHGPYQLWMKHSWAVQRANNQPCSEQPFAFSY